MNREENNMPELNIPENGVEHAPSEHPNPDRPRGGCGRCEAGRGRRRGPEEVDSPNDLATKLARCGQFLFHQAGAQRGQGRILKILSLTEKMTQRELQEILMIQPGSLSETAAKLEDKGLILRERDEEDKRKVVLSLTEEGAKVVASYGEEKGPKGQLFATLSEEEYAQLEGLMDKLLTDWEAQFGKEHMARGGRGGHRGHHGPGKSGSGECRRHHGRQGKCGPGGRHHGGPRHTPEA